MLSKFSVSVGGHRKISSLPHKNKQPYNTHHHEKSLEVALRSIHDQISISEVREEVHAMGF